MRVPGLRFRYARAEITRKDEGPGSFDWRQTPGPSVLSAFGGGLAGPLCLAAPTLSSAVGGRGLGLLEEPTYRLYHCRRCGVQVQICPRCDHGNIYCAGECARLARRECMRRAGARYQRSLRGARRHAERQRHYRERQYEVTHQGCESLTGGCRVSVGPLILTELVDGPSQTPAHPRSRRPQGICAFCGAVLPAFARLHPWRWGG